MENVVIIGSGPAGYTAGIYAARANLDPLILEGFLSGGMPGGQLMTTGIVENFPGWPQGIDGQQLMANMRQQNERLGTRMVMEDVESLNLQSPPFSVVSTSGTVYESKVIIIATGATARRLPLESEKRLWGKGISACAVCDGALPAFRNKQLAVIGGGDTAIEEATHLTHFGSRVYLIHRRDELRASKVMQKRALTHPSIEILWNKTVAEFLGQTTLEGVRLVDTVTGEETTLDVSGAFEAIGHIPNTAFLGGQVALSKTGYIVTEKGSTGTSVAGVFAAGDVQDAVYRQAITAAGTGCMAAIEAERWLATTRA